MRHLCDEKEQFEYHLQDKRNEIFAVSVAGYQASNRQFEPGSVAASLTPLMLGKVAFSKIRKVICIPLVRAELQMRGVETDNKMKISDLIAMLKQKRVDGDCDKYFLPMAAPIEEWV